MRFYTENWLIAELNGIYKVLIGQFSTKFMIDKHLQLILLINLHIITFFVIIE